MILDQEVPKASLEAFVLFIVVVVSCLAAVSQIKNQALRVLGLPKNFYLEIGLGLWLALLGALSWSGFFMNFGAFPPRFLIAIVPTFIFIIAALLLKPWRSVVNEFSISSMTWLHIVRIPVEIVLWWLFLNGLVPKLMTFEGINWDILSGITAPLAALVFLKPAFKKINLVWNIVCLGLLINIVVHAVLSAPLPFQQLAFDQPNIAVFQFPFIWLPGFVVPVVLFLHIATISRLIKSLKIISH